MKSGYWLATHIPDNDLLHIPPHGDPQIKSEIWKSHTAPKLKHFLWRMLSRALPTGEELEKRHISSDGFLSSMCLSDGNNRALVLQLPACYTDLEIV